MNAPSPLSLVRSWLREVFGLVPVLDLHGLGVKQALAECDAFLSEAQRAGVRSVKIVYGKGNRSPGGIGVLRQVVPHWLEHGGSSRVERYERLVDATGGDGAVRIWLQPPQIG